LRNVVEETVLLASDSLIQPGQLTFCAMLGAPAGTASSGEPAGELCPAIPRDGLNLEQVERNLVQQALQRTSWNVARAARLLGVSRDTLRYRIEKYNLIAEQGTGKI